MEHKLMKISRKVEQKTERGKIRRSNILKKFQWERPEKIERILSINEHRKHFQH